MTQSVYVNSNDGSNPVLGLLLIPALVPPGYLAWLTWTQLSASGVHPMFVVLAVAAEMVAIIGALYFFFQYMPRMISIAATTIYMGAMYWWVFSLFADRTWTLGAAVAAAIAGFFVARYLTADNLKQRDAAYD